MTLSELNVFKRPGVKGSQRLPEFADVALAEIDSEGCILSLNTFGKTVWGWKKGDKLPSLLFSTLRTGEPIALTNRHNGLPVKGTGVKREKGWLLVGYHEKNTQATASESSFRTLIENIPPLNHPFIEQAPQGILFLDRIGNVIFANRQFRDFLSIDPNRTVVDNVFQLFGFDDGLTAKIRSLLEKGDSIEHHIDRRQPSSESLRIIGSPVHDTEASILGAVLTLESRRPASGPLANETTHQVNDHPQLALLKNVFIAMMSHEIRTPLGVMNGYAEILGQELEEYEATTGNLLPLQIKEFVGAIHENAQRLLGIVNELFDLSNMRQLSLSPVTVHDVLAPVAEHTQRTLHEKGVSFELELSEENLVVLGNEARLNQVFKNLLSNAVKFTHRGSVSVSTRRNGSHVVIEVVDTGIGISQDYLDQLFTPFLQEDTRLNRNFSGAGLGLAVVKLLVDLMNGRIEVESEKGRGSTFRIFLPAP